MVSPTKVCRLTSQDCTEVIFQDLELPFFCNSVYTEGDYDLPKVFGNLRKDTISFLMMTGIE